MQHHGGTSYAEPSDNPPSYASVVATPSNYVAGEDQECPQSGQCANEKILVS